MGVVTERVKIQAAVSKYGVGYADILDASNNHRTWGWSLRDCGYKLQS